MIDAADISPKDRILEIGPGLGFLTTELVRRATQVVAIEKDRTLAAFLVDHFAKASNLTVIQGDALQVGKCDCTKVVCSPPYNISSKLVLFALDKRFELTILLLQHEFVNRLIAASGSRDYGRLSVVFQAQAEAKCIATVSRSAFYPKPRVDSAIVKIKPRTDPLPIHDEFVFEDLVRFLFTQRRRRLRRVLTRYLENTPPPIMTSILKQVNILERRIFQITPRELVDLSNQVKYAQEEGHQTDS
jgi:16S rRNA (adenine1518-N6/adenine1519-N6)-dimethyltransferase